MDKQTDRGVFGAFLKRFATPHESLPPRVSACQIFYRLAELEEEAACFYEGLSQFTDDPWISRFAANSALAERMHHKWYVNTAQVLDTDAEQADSMTTLPDEIRQLMCKCITPRKEAARKSADYLGKKDVLDVAIAAEDSTIRLLEQVHPYVPTDQHGIIHKVLQEELKHKSALEGFRRTIS